MVEFRVCMLTVDSSPFFVDLLFHLSDDCTLFLIEFIHYWVFGSCVSVAVVQRIVFFIPVFTVIIYILAASVASVAFNCKFLFRFIAVTVDTCATKFTYVVRCARLFYPCTCLCLCKCINNKLCVLVHSQTTRSRWILAEDVHH